MKRAILDWVDPSAFKENNYLLARSGNSYSIISSDFAAHRSTAKTNKNYIEMNNYAEDYVWDQKYPDIPETYLDGCKNVATNTGLVLIFYTDGNKLIIYDLLVDNDANKLDFDYKVKSPTFPQDRAETRRYSIDKGQFVMDALFKDDCGYYGIIESMKTINIDENKYKNNTAFTAAIGCLKNANMNKDVINQGFTFSTERTFNYIILPSKKYFRTSGNVTIYGPNKNSVVCLDDNGIATTNTAGTFWYIEEPFYTSEPTETGSTDTTGIGFVILKYAGTDSCILEVS